MAQANHVMVTNRSFSINRADLSVEERTAFLKSEIAKMPPILEEFFKPSVRIPYVDCIESIYVTFPS